MKTTVKILAAIVAVAALFVMASGFTMKGNAAEIQIINPMHAVSQEEMEEMIDIPFVVPEGAEDVRFYVFVIDGEPTIAEMDFTLEGKEYCCRATEKEMDATELSGVYFTACTEEETEVNGFKGTLYTGDLTSVLFWKNTRYNYFCAISCTDCEEPASLLDIAAAVYDDSGVGYAEMPTEYPDLAGVWTGINGNTVELIPNGEHTYEVNVSIIRLSQFPGTAEEDTLAAYLTLEDPNGEELYAEFYPNEDGTCTLVITESIWSLLPSQTKFTGFVRAE